MRRKSKILINTNRSKEQHWRFLRWLQKFEQINWWYYFTSKLAKPEMWTVGKPITFWVLRPKCWIHLAQLRTWKRKKLNIPIKHSPYPTQNPAHQLHLCYGEMESGVNDTNAASYSRSGREKFKFDSIIIESSSSESNLSISISGSNRLASLINFLF